MITRSVTAEQVMGWGPCSSYNREVVEELFAGRERLTAADIAALDVPASDRLWALLHPEFLTDTQMHELACQFAESVVHLCGDDPRPRAAIEAKHAWLRGEIDDEQLDTAQTAARAAAWTATRVATGAAAGAAARAAAWAAAVATTEVAAEVAARVAARAWQITMTLVEIGVEVEEGTIA